jgi:glycosyltransferase involved in cell wall biosynthesis
MKIIQVHNYYQQAGGEDAVVAAELSLLRDRGHEVVTYYKDNEALGAGLWALVTASLQTLWNWETYREFRKLLQCEKPDVVHCHNTFPLISPSIYWACAKEKLPVVQTLHNYRMLCLNAFLFRQGKAVSCGPLAVSNEKAKSQKLSANGSICELCVSKSFKWPGVKYGCYRDSKAGSLVVALMLFVHKLLGTWTKKVTAYIALTEFQKQKMIEGGLPREKVFIKPNFLQRSEIRGQRSEGDNDLNPNNLNPKTGEAAAPYCLFVGRLSPEKGCDVLIRAWALFQASLTPNAECPMPSLLIVGDGPERDSLEKLTSDLGSLASVNFLGKQPKEEVLSLMQQAEFLVLPSVWYEGFPMTIVESFSNGLPVVASNIGSMNSVIESEQNGLKFEAGDPDSLADKLTRTFANLDQMLQMGEQARRDFEENYSATANYKQLADIYQGCADEDDNE